MKGLELGHSKTIIPYLLHIPADDHESFDLGKFFHQAANYINDCLQRTNIMVHCMAGVSRSVSLVISYLIKHRGYPYQRAYDLVKSRRRIIHPNDGFIHQLRMFEREHSVKALSTSPSKRHLERDSSLSASPAKKYAPNREIEAIISKYENYKSLAFNGLRKNPETTTPLDLKKIESYSPEKTPTESSHFRCKRVASMNI